MTATEAAHSGVADSGHSPSNSIAVTWGLIVGVANALHRSLCGGSTPGHRAMPSPSP